MKVAILAGGVGSRISEETIVKPKPMVEIGGKPILWHIMMHYSAHGFREFIIALGYKGEYIKRYMAEFCALSSDLRIDLRSGVVEPQQRVTHDWVVDLVDTGMNTQTGGRIKRLARHVGNTTFLATYGDGVSTVDLPALLRFHQKHGKLATVTAVRPPARFGRLDLDGDQVVRFAEKPVLDQGWINGAFFVLEPGVLDYIEGDETNFEAGVLEQLAREGQLMAYRHEGFWQCMDTLRDKILLEKMWDSGSAPWKRWE